MKSVLFSLVAVFLLVPTSGRAADATGGEAAFLFAYEPKPGHQEQFDAGYRRHLERSPSIAYVADRRMVTDQGVVTTTGITASMPMMLTLIEAIAGREKAESVARDLGLPGIHEEENAVNALELLDGETRRIISSRHGSFDLSTPGEIETAQMDTNPADDVDAKGAAIRAAFDSLLYAIDRVRSVYATKPPIVTENEISPATFYYCDLIVRRHEYVIRCEKKGSDCVDQPERSHRPRAMSSTR